MEVSMNNRFRLFAATTLAALAGLACAQTPDTGRAPGERGGVPSGRDTNTGREEAIKRCNDLEGVLREQCLRNADSAGSGSTSEPRVAPPPQNPR
jgi:hypothetical protein